MLLGIAMDDAVDVWLEAEPPEGLHHLWDLEGFRAQPRVTATERHQSGCHVTAAQLPRGCLT